MTIATKVDHIGIAVANLDEAIKSYCAVLNMKPEEISIEEFGGMRIAMIPAGESLIELLESKDPNSNIGKFIATKGEGLHHIAVGVKNLKKEIDSLVAKNVPMVDKEPKPGAGNTKIAFVHPKATKILLELVEDTRK